MTEKLARLRPHDAEASMSSYGGYPAWFPYFVGVVATVGLIAYNVGHLF